MVTNFEEITSELNAQELEIIQPFIAGFKAVRKESALKGPEVVKKMNSFLGTHGYPIRMNEVRLRKCINYIRTNGLLPIIGTSKGYYVSTDRKEIEAQIASLNQRAKSIRTCAVGLQKMLETM